MKYKYFIALATFAAIAYCTIQKASCDAGVITDCGCLKTLVSCINAPDANHASCSAKYEGCKAACISSITTSIVPPTSTLVLNPATTSASNGTLPLSSGSISPSPTSTFAPVNGASHFVDRGIPLIGSSLVVAAFLV